MAIINKGKSFANGEQLTADKLNQVTDNATFASGAVDSVSTQLSGGAIIVKDGGVSTAKIADDAVTTAKIADSNVTKAKIENVANMKVLGNTSGSATAPEEVEVIDDDTMATALATNLATAESIKTYVDSLKSNVALATKLDTQTTAGSENVWYEVTGLNPSLTTTASNSNFRISAGISWCATNQGYGIATKVMYSLNGGAYTDFSLPPAPDGRIACHASSWESDIATWMLKLNFDVFLTGLSYSVGDTIAFKLYVQSPYANGFIYINRQETDSTGNDNLRGITTLSAEEIHT